MLPFRYENNHDRWLRCRHVGCARGSYLPDCTCFYPSRPVDTEDAVHMFSFRDFAFAAAFVLCFLLWRFGHIFRHPWRFPFLAVSAHSVPRFPNKTNKTKKLAKYRNTALRPRVRLCRL